MQEYYPSLTYYGIGAIIRKYSSFPTFLPLPVSIQHGWDIAPNAHDAREDAPENWYWSCNLEAQYQQSYPRVKTRAIGAPFLYLLKSVEYEPARKSERKGSIVFPSHSSDLVEMKCDFDKYAAMLASLPDLYKPITVCLYYIDKERGFDRPFLRHGFDVVSNGANLYEAQFLLNFIYNTRGKRFSFSNQMTSALLFASAMGLTSFFWGPEFTVNNEDPHWQHLDYSHYFRTWEANFAPYFTFPVCDFDEQIRCVDVELGRRNLLSPAEMRKRLIGLLSHSVYLRKSSRVIRGYAGKTARAMTRIFTGRSG
ncbi:hypothetical protein [uncultured Thiodictyon sp.]|jgi:hypothetical protein|uniref:hypothetical protein n=1 Tax=uncultured Thiodictyon sp. TaxID=1846217 RepID=UPI0025FCC550|nr:hypothetical protein [uncultured Thiodictyon sp.]